MNGLLSNLTWMLLGAWLVLAVIGMGKALDKWAERRRPPLTPMEEFGEAIKRAGRSVNRAERREPPNGPWRNDRVEGL